MDDNKTVTADEKPGSGFNLIEFIRETRRETAKVTWPTRKETIIFTVYIVGMALIVGLFFFGIDYLLGIAVGKLLGMQAS